MTNVKLKIDLINGIVELEGSEEFAKTELPKVLELLESGLRKPNVAKKPDALEIADEEIDESKKLDEQKADLGEFIAKINPETNNQIVATVAYYFAFIDKEHGAEFKNNEILKLYTGLIRKPKPARASNLCSDCYSQEKWVRGGAKKGYWQISEDGQKFIEKKLNPVVTA